MTAPVGSVTVPRTAPALPLCAAAESAAEDQYEKGKNAERCATMERHWKSPEHWLEMRKVIRGENGRGVLSAFEEHRSASTLRECAGASPDETMGNWGDAAPWMKTEKMP